MKRYVVIAVAVIAAALLLAACGGVKSNPSAAQKAQRASNALQNQVYQAQHNIEFRNYNWRQEISDDPATILWCTFFPVTPGQQPFTVPIAGKLTSSNKRSYQTTYYIDAGSNSWYPQERPGPDHMYGSSSEYRYGFGPTGKADYTDFTDMQSVCTTQPKVWQANTIIVTSTSTTLQSISKAAHAALAKGNAAKAEAILNQAGNVTAKPKP